VDDVRVQPDQPGFDDTES